MCDGLFGLPVSKVPRGVSCQCHKKYIIFTAMMPLDPCRYFSHLQTNELDDVPYTRQVVNLPSPNNKLL